MDKIWHILFLILCLNINIILCQYEFEVVKMKGRYNHADVYNVSDSKEVIVTFPVTRTIYPYRISVESDNATVNKPVLVVVKQQKDVISWQVPLIVETSTKDHQLLFFNTSRTVCHNSMDKIVHKYFHDTARNIKSPLIYFDLIFQYFIVVLSSSSRELTNVTLTVEEEADFYIEENKNYSLSVSPSQPRYVMYRFAINESDTLIIEIESNDDICLTVSVQNSTCPVFDLNKDITFEGQYQTINTKGAITVAKRNFAEGFFLVFVAKPDNFDCSQKHSILPIPNSRPVIAANRTSMITFKVQRSIDGKDYVFAVIITVVAILIFCLKCLIMVCIFSKHGSLAKHVNLRVDSALPPELFDETQPVSNVEIERYLMERTLTLQSLAKYPMKDKRRSFNYLWHILSIAIFYSIPVVQLVITYQRVANQTGNQDMCYYNFLCAHPAFGLSDFNHVYSNIGYCLTGVLFLIVILHRHVTIPIRYEVGIPVHYGLFYAMGIALIIEGLLSACYHICPSQSNYQFDTSFMYVMAVLCMIKLYQNRHPDINATAYATFTVLGVAIFLAMIGILNGSLLVWIIFSIMYSLLCIYISFKIYFLSFIMEGMIKLKTDLQEHGFTAKAFAPVKKVRFLLLLLTNVINYSILITSLVLYNKGVTDFGTFLLGLLMLNAIIHCIFYTLMKIINRERICFEAIIYGLLAIASWAAATVFFLDPATLWTVTPAESRQWNEDCILMDFYDKHDVWHLLSAPALYYTFMFLLCLDDDLFDKRQSDILVF